MRRAYKITTLGNESFLIRKRSKLVYPPNVWVKSLYHQYGYGICVFNNYDAACNFAQIGYDMYKLWEVLVRNVYIALPIALPCYLLSYQTIPQILNSSVYADGNWPNGTIMAEEIKLIKLVTIFTTQHI